jgi:hypothetical protein
VREEKRSMEKKRGREKLPFPTFGERRIKE